MSKAILGIDVSKKELMVALLISDQSIQKKKFNNDIKGFNEILKWLQIRKLDAVIIAEYGKQSNLFAYKPKAPKLKEIRYLYRCLNDLKKQKIEITNHLENKDNLPKSVCNTWQRLSKILQKEIEIVEKNIEKNLEQNSDINYKYKNLQTIPRIGKTTAVAILAESPDLTQFANARQFAAYAGLVPKHRSSGSSNLRKAIYFPAIVAKNHNPVMHAFSDKLKKKGKHTMVIIGAIMRKLLHIIFGVLKNNTRFDPEYVNYNKKYEILC